MFTSESRTAFSASSRTVSRQVPRPGARFVDAGRERIENLRSSSPEAASPVHARGSSQQRLDSGLQLGALDLLPAQPLTGFLAALEEHDRRAAGHHELRGKASATLPEDPDEPDLACDPLSD